MKNTFSLIGVATLLLSVSSDAIERLSPVKEPEIKAVAGSPAAQKKAWLGVAGQSIDKALAAQLGIQHGVTLELVAPDGSAGKAGIKKFDVITKIGEHDIKSMEDLRSVMQGAEVNQSLAVEVFSGGELKTHNVVLDAHPGNFAHAGKGRARIRPLADGSLSQGALPQFQHSLADQRIHKMVEEQLKQMEQHFAQMDIQAADLQAMGNQSLQMNMSGSGAYSSSVTLMDEAGSIRIKSSSKTGKYVEVKDKEGQLLYSGPYETEEDKNAVPTDIRKRIDALGVQQSSSGRGFLFGK